MGTQGRPEAQNQQIAVNAITQVPTMTRAELAMYHHQSQETPRPICDLPRINMGPQQESSTAIRSDRERTHGYVKKRVKVDQINSKANNQGKKGYQ